jgi:hypothetical protein
MAKSTQKKTETNQEVLSELKVNYNDKLKYMIGLLDEKYQDPTFYIQKHELNMVLSLIAKDITYVSQSPIFVYNENRYNVENLGSRKNYNNLIEMNFIYIFHDFQRNPTNGEFVFQGKIIGI